MLNNLLNFKKILIFGSITLFLHSCGGFLKPDWSKVAEPDGKKRARKMLRKVEVSVLVFLNQKKIQILLLHHLIHYGELL